MGRVGLCQAERYCCLPMGEIGQKVFLPGRNDNNREYMLLRETFVHFIEHVVSLLPYLST